MNFFKYTLSLLAILLLFACTNFSDVKIYANPDEVKVKSVKGTTFKMHIPVEVDNPTSKKLILKNAKFDVLRKTYSFAKMELSEKVEFPANSKNKYLIILNGKIVDPMGAMFSRFSVREADAENYTLSGFAKIGTSALSKKIRIKNESFSNLINSINQ